MADFDAQRRGKGSHASGRSLFTAGLGDFNHQRRAEWKISDIATKKNRLKIAIASDALSLRLTQHEETQTAGEKYGICQHERLSP
jgi:hypothetical protein